ncbi:MAG: PQQ-dependent sugar dehydrogenase [Acidobacteriota bacterium]
MLLSLSPSIPRIAGSLVAAAFLASLAAAPPVAAQPPADLMLETVATGLDRPVAIRNAGDGTDRLFIVEQDGVIKVLDNGAVLPTPFIDLTTPVVSGGEQGLLGLAFHPDYVNNGYFYVNYTRSGSPLDQTVVERYQVSAGNPNVADPTSGFEVIVIDQTFSNHNGGDIHFNPIDGYLYIGMGDGGGWDTSQDLTTLLGKMLRIDVDGASPYAVPPGNPYVGDPSALDEIWASGLRNPWRWSFDRATGDLLIGDVGEGSWEEMNYAAHDDAGVNYGWPCKEGNADFQPSFCDGTEVLTPPFYEISRSTGACSVIGGYMYRGSQIPSLDGYVLFNDWCSGEAFFATQTSPGVWQTALWTTLPGFNLVGYGEDEGGEIYLTLGEEILRLVSPSGAGLIYRDGFESGDTTAWTTTVP